MQRTSVILGITIGAILVAAGIGASSAVDTLQGPAITDVTVERINDTHAAVSWTTDRPTHGYISIYVSQQCPPVWANRKRISGINDSSFTRTHLVVAPIYEMNESRIKSQVNLSEVPGNGSLKYYDAEVEAWDKEMTTADYRTILQRNLSQVCQ